MPGDSKTEKATPKKRKDTRKKGNVALSKDIIALVTLVGGFYALQVLFPSIYEEARTYLLKYISDMGSVTQFDDHTLRGMGMQMITSVAKMVLPILLIMFILGILSTGVQTRFLFTTENMLPKFSKLNPLKGIKNLFSLKNMVELLKNLLKITVLIILLFNLVKGDLIGIARTINMDVKGSAVYLLDAIMKMIFQVVLAFAVISGFDFFYQRWDYERQIKMSKQEVKEEYKQLEGNPEIKGKIRDMQRQRARSRMMQAVPDADVIIRNPTHFAVALKYDIDKNNAPILVAKGQDELALRIVRIGEENNVTIVENKPLARAIYASTQINSEIPEEYYGAVAEILVYVFKINHNGNR